MPGTPIVDSCVTGVVSRGSSCDGDTLAEGVGLTDGETDADGLTDGLADDEGETELEGETDGLGDGLTDGETLLEGLTEADGEGETDGLTELDGLTDADGETDGDPVADSISARKTAAVSPVTASVGLLVSPVLVLMRNSPRSKTAAALLRDLATEIAVKPPDTVMSVVLLASLPNPRK